MDANIDQKPYSVTHNGSSPEAEGHKSASVVLRAVIDNARSDTISIGEIMQAFGERAFGFVLILFSLPNCVPAPPGIAGIVGTPVLIFGVQMLLGHKHPWLPGFIRRRTVSVSKFKRLIDMAEPKLQKLEGYCRPRLTQLFNPLGDRVVGLFALPGGALGADSFPRHQFSTLHRTGDRFHRGDGGGWIPAAGGYLIGLAGLAYTVTILGASYQLIHTAITSWF